MEPMQVAVEAVKLLVAIAGAIGVAWYWNAQRHKLEQYRHRDDAYNEILAEYFQNPVFGDPERTASYGESFKGTERWKYHYFAMRVHTFLEAIYDFSNGAVSDVWAPVFRHHTQLHASWLHDHRHLHLEGYVQEALRGKG